MMQGIDNNAAAYKAVKWALAGTQLMAHLLHCITDYTDTVTTVLKGVCRTCENLKVDSELEEALGNLVTHAGHLTYNSEDAASTANRLNQECETLFRRVLATQDSGVALSGFDELDRIIPQIKEEVEGLSDNAFSLREGVMGIYERVAYGAGASSTVTAACDESLDVLGEITKSLTAVYDALAIIENESNGIAGHRF